MRLQDSLTNDHEKRYNSIHQQRSLLNVLRRPVEIAANSRPSSERMDKQLHELSEWQESEKQTLVIDLK
jgi:hypothetical protein